MVDVGVLRCPVCEMVHLSRPARVEDTERLKEVASEHLHTHLLDESKHGIYRLMMADRVTQTDIDERADVPLGNWIEASGAVSAVLKGSDPNTQLPQQE